MIYFGQAREERKHLKAIEHFLGKRIRYGRDVLPEKTLTRLQEARGSAKDGLRWGISRQGRGEILKILESQYGDLLRTD